MKFALKRLNYRLENILKKANFHHGNVQIVDRNLKSVKIMGICVNAKKMMNIKFVTLALIWEI